jgi:hypothetical protein
MSGRPEQPSAPTARRCRHRREHRRPLRRELPIIALLNTCTHRKPIWADAGYDGKAFAAWIHAAARIAAQVV